MGRTKAAAADVNMQLMDHVRELRTRLMIVGVVFLLTSSIAYVFRQPVLDLLLSPLNGQKLIYLNPAGGFNFVLLVSFYVGLALTSPILLQQLYRFVRPVLPSAVQHYSARLFFASIFLLISGMCFGYYYAIPGALRFLYSFAAPYISATLTADSYLNFIVAYTVGLGIVFQLPLLMLIFHWIKPQKPRNLLRNERLVILLAFLAAAIITPTPDPINQTIIALPIIAIYQGGIVLVMLSIRSNAKATKQALQSQALATPVSPKYVPQAHAQVPAAPTIVKTQFQPHPVQSVTRPVRSVDGFIVRRPVTMPRPVINPVAVPARSTRPSLMDDVIRVARQPKPISNGPVAA